MLLKLLGCSRARSFQFSRGRGDWWLYGLRHRREKNTTSRGASHCRRRIASVGAPSEYRINDRLHRPNVIVPQGFGFEEFRPSGVRTSSAGLQPHKSLIQNSRHLPNQSRFCALHNGRQYQAIHPGIWRGVFMSSDPRNFPTISAVSSAFRRVSAIGTFAFGLAITTTWVALLGYVLIRLGEWAIADLPSALNG